MTLAVRLGACQTLTGTLTAPFVVATTKRRNFLKGRLLLLEKVTDPLVDTVSRTFTILTLMM